MKFSFLLPATAFLYTSLSAQVKKHTPAASAKKAPVQNIAASINSGKAVYTQYCLTCHQADGGGVQNMNPPLIKTSYVLGDKGRIIKIVLNGFNQKVDIDGDTYNNIMPSFNYLSNQQVADVLTFVRNSFTNKASAVTVDEVNKIRPAGKK
ncbi:c-type cytochrome [Mucilaginibacter robiniae]|uniref:C-type cytochrome n=1 Tax=Mucilaginibacter robiniae TaxID=2728022 RepID=A0A7L5E501_9SPHI|nr:cytochrome c [Mucilaginibacter robiniae]QJD98135.1 c-type cytochrome [Mucilaginibacter robiniae]